MAKTLTITEARSQLLDRICVCAGSCRLLDSGRYDLDYAHDVVGGRIKSDVRLFAL